MQVVTLMMFDSWHPHITPSHTHNHKSFECWEFLQTTPRRMELRDHKKQAYGNSENSAATYPTHCMHLISASCIFLDCSDGPESPYRRWPTQPVCTKWHDTTCESRNIFWKRYQAGCNSSVRILVSTYWKCCYVSITVSARWHLLLKGLQQT